MSNYRPVSRFSFVSKVWNAWLLVNLSHISRNDHSSPRCNRPIRLVTRRRQLFWRSWMTFLSLWTMVKLLIGPSESKCGIWHRWSCCCIFSLLVQKSSTPCRLKLSDGRKNILSGLRVSNLISEDQVAVQRTDRLNFLTRSREDLNLINWKMVQPKEVSD